MELGERRAEISGRIGRRGYCSQDGVYEKRHEYTPSVMIMDFPLN